MGIKALANAVEFLGADAEDSGCLLKGEGIIAIPLSAVVGTLVGGFICVFVYIANKRFKSTVGLTIFTVSLFLLLSAGLFSGGCHKFEMVYGFTPVVWTLSGDFWSVNRLPMTIFKPFGYSDQRTVVQMVTFWTWLLLSLALHFIKYKRCRKPAGNPDPVDTQWKESTKSTHSIKK